MIGLLDSGVGGLTVARTLLARFPGLAIHYYGDTAHVPYGSRSAGEVRRLVEAIVVHLVDRGVEAVVLACNTSSALVLESLRSWCPRPVVGIIEPAARAAVEATRNGRIGLIANPLTVASGAYDRAVARMGGAGVRLFAVGCARLVPMVESGQVRGGAVRRVLREYLAPFQELGIDTLIHGCTHYPFLAGEIASILGPEVVQVDPAEYVLEELALEGWIPRSSGGVPVCSFEVSGCPHDFERIATMLLGARVSGVNQVSLSQPHSAAG